MAKDFQRVHDVLEQLVSDYAYAVHQPHARNGGLIGLAAAAIALGTVSSLRSFYHGLKPLSPPVTFPRGPTRVVRWNESIIPCRTPVPRSDPGD